MRDVICTSVLPFMHSTPRLESSCARLLAGSRVRTRIAYGDGEPSAQGSSRDFITARPCAPVPPMTRMIFFSSTEEVIADEVVYEVQR